MDTEKSSPQYGLGIDAGSKEYLSEASRWALFLSITGFIICGIIILAGILAPSIFRGMIGNMDESQLRGMSADTLASMISVFYVCAAILYFFPCLYLYRFALRTKKALSEVDQEALISAFQNLKSMFRFVGILTLIMLCLLLLNVFAMIFSGGIPS